MTTPNDPILDALMQEALDDPETDGLLLSGSRAAGQATPTSEYDLYWMLADQARVRRASQQLARRTWVPVAATCRYRRGSRDARRARRHGSPTLPIADRPASAYRSPSA